jgi:hypothetical protein
MKSLKIVMIVSASLISIGAAVSTRNRVELDIIELEAKPLESVYEAPVLTEKDLIEALIQVESRGNDSAIGDRHLVGNEAVGALQIRPIMVREVNRILKIKKSEKRFKMSDRWDREKTIEMFLIWKNHHHPDGDFEKIARNWNGGPKGFKSSRTEKYWVKVQQELDI